MRVVVDIETNGLDDPDKIWVICAKDIDKGTDYVFEEPYKDWTDFQAFASKVTLWIGHNIIPFDIVHLNRLVPSCAIDHRDCIDTLVVSRLINYIRKEGHSLESWGEEFGIAKPEHEDWSQYSPEMRHRCVQDVEINYRLYKKFLPYLQSAAWKSSLRTEHDMAFYCESIYKNGFWFNLEKSKELYKRIYTEVDSLSKNLKESFLPKSRLLKVYCPRGTKHGTIAKNSVPKNAGPDLSVYSVDCPFSTFKWEEFNPASTKQRMERLHETGWQPTEKTKGHNEFLRSIRGRRKGLSEKEQLKLEYFNKYGWTTSEENLETLPADAPKAALTLVRYLLVVARRRKLLGEWLPAVRSDHRIHGTITPLGTWTHRASHSKPNLGNVFKWNPQQPEKTPYSDELRALFGVPEDRYLVGVDAEGIQLRILAHYMNDKDFSHSIVYGKKEDGTDPHSLNREALGSTICKSRDAAKTFIYAWLLGAKEGRVSQILDCSRQEASEADENFFDKYTNLRYIKESVIPQDAANGYFRALDGRYVMIFGDDYDKRKHLALGGYLQSGEAIIMKQAMCLWWPKLIAEKIPFWVVNWVHDEYQIETVRDKAIAEHVARIVADSITTVGLDLKLNCPMAGSILNSHGQLAIGSNWMETH